MAEIIGPDSTPGPAGAYRHVQSIPAAVWSVVHNLGYRPGGVLVEDSAGDDAWGGEVTHVSDNELTITFGAEFGGKAYLS